MKQIKQDFTKNWEVSIVELKNTTGTKYKVTKRLFKFPVAETKIFDSKEEAVAQFNEWLK